MGQTCGKRPANRTRNERVGRGGFEGTQKGEVKKDGRGFWLLSPDYRTSKLFYVGILTKAFVLSFV